LLRKQRKTLGGYFILPHPVDLWLARCRQVLFAPTFCRCDKSP